MLDKKIINFDGLSRYHEKLNEVLKTKQDVISDLDEIRSGAELGSTALQDIPDSSITFDKLNQEVLDELYGYGLEIYSSVDELPDDDEQGTLATVVNYYSGEVLVEDKFSVRDIYVGENPDCDPILEFRFNEITRYPEQFGDGFSAIFGRKDIPLENFNEYYFEEFIFFIYDEGKFGFRRFEEGNDDSIDVIIYETNDDGTISLNAENVSILNEHIQSIGGVVCYGCYNKETESFVDPTDDHFDFIDTFLSYVIGSHTEIVERKDNEIYFKTNDGWENYNTLNLVNNLTDGGADKALSAEMGKILNEKITDFISGSNIESLKFKGYVNVDTKDGVDAIYEELSINEACLVVPSTRNFGVSDGGTMDEDSYISWILGQVHLCEDLYNFEPSSLKNNLSGLISGDFGELKTYFVLDKEHPYAVCPDLLLLAKVNVRIKQFLELSGDVSKFILSLIPDDATITACIGKIIRWSGGDWLVHNMDDLNNLLYPEAPEYDNNLTHKYGYNYDMDKALETGIIGYTTICTSGLPSGIRENYTVIVNGSTDADPNYRTITQFAYGRTGAASNRVWTRVLFKAVVSGYRDDFKPWIEISSVKSVYNANEISFNPINDITSTNVQDVIEEVVNKFGYGVEIYSSVDELPSDAPIGTIASVLYKTEDSLDSFANYIDVEVTASVNYPDTLPSELPTGTIATLDVYYQRWMNFRIDFECDSDTSSEYHLKFYLDGDLIEHPAATYNGNFSGAKLVGGVPGVSLPLRSSNCVIARSVTNKSTLDTFILAKVEGITKLYVKNISGWEQYSELVDGSVTTEKISNDSVTIDKLSPELKESMSKVSTFLDASVQSDEIIDTLKEIQEYIESDESGAAAMIESIVSTKSDVEQLKQSIVVLTEEKYNNLFKNGTINEETIYIVKFE